MIPIKRLAGVTLGKMLQTEASSPFDLQANYLRAAHVQPHGRLISFEDDQLMWFSPPELRTSLRAGDVVIVEGGAGFGRSAVLERDLPGWGFQNSIVRLRPAIGRADGRFLDYCLQSALAEGTTGLVCSTATIPHFTAEKVAAFQVPAPNLSSQVAIADFLDRETAKIDALIDKQSLLSARLSERLSAMIEALVLGADQAEAVESEVPTGWTRLRNKNVLREIIDLSEDGSEEPLSVSHLTGVTPRSEKSVSMIESESYVGYKRVKPNDLVINTMWAWMGALGVSPYAGLVSPAYGVYRPRKGVGIDPRFLDVVYRSRGYVAAITNRSRGVWTSRLRIYPDVFLRMPILVPSLDEQISIMRRIDEAAAIVKELIDRAQRLSEVASERRAALITAAVTGQLDVSTGKVA